jgi:hypothetical protein
LAAGRQRGRRAGVRGLTRRGNIDAGRRSKDLDCQPSEKWLSSNHFTRTAPRCVRATLCVVAGLALRGWGTRFLQITRLAELSKPSTVPQRSFHALSKTCRLTESLFRGFFGRGEFQVRILPKRDSLRFGLSIWAPQLKRGLKDEMGTEILVGREMALRVTCPSGK